MRKVFKLVAVLFGECEVLRAKRMFVFKPRIANFRLFDSKMRAKNLEQLMGAKRFFAYLDK